MGRIAKVTAKIIPVYKFWYLRRHIMQLFTPLNMIGFTLSESHVLFEVDADTCVVKKGDIVQTVGLDWKIKAIVESVVITTIEPKVKIDLQNLSALKKEVLDIIITDIKSGGRIGRAILTGRSGC